MSQMREDLIWLVFVELWFDLQFHSKNGRRTAVEAAPIDGKQAYMITKD